MSNAKNYCALAFNGLQIFPNGELNPCCLYKSNDNPNYQKFSIFEYSDWWKKGTSKLKENVIADKIDPGCKYCITETSVPHPLRISSNRHYDSQNNIRNQPYHPEKPTWINLSFGNYCNLKCIMCSPRYSSQLEQEYLTHPEKLPQFQHHVIKDQIGITDKFWWENPVILNQVKDILSSAHFVNFAGGEPLMGPKLFELLDVIPLTCRIFFNTNLTKLNEKFIDKIEKFSKVTISASIDGVGSHQEYIRYGSNWSVLDRNIRRTQQIKMLELFEVSFILQHTSVYTWPAFWQYMNDQNIRVELFDVYVNTNEGSFTINSVSPHDYEQFKNWNDSHPGPHSQRISAWLNTYTFDIEAHRKFKLYVNTLDQIRGCNFKETFNPTWIN